MAHDPNRIGRGTCDFCGQTRVVYESVRGEQFCQACRTIDTDLPTSPTPAGICTEACGTYTSGTKECDRCRIAICSECGIFNQRTQETYCERRAVGEDRN